jgi:DNA-binding LacI/PurR family transcriptional regulator
MLLQRRPVDAVICSNDVMAIGVRDAAERLLRLNVPKDLAIVGHDGISMGAWECHSITTLAFDRVAYFDAIVGIIERENEVRGNNETVMPCHVRWRSST